MAAGSSRKINEVLNPRFLSAAIRTLTAASTLSKPGLVYFAISIERLATKILSDICQPPSCLTGNCISFKLLVEGVCGQLKGICDQPPQRPGINSFLSSGPRPPALDRISG